MSVSVRSVPAPTSAQLAPILRDLGRPGAIVVTDIKDGKVFRIDLADGTSLVLKSYDHFNTKHYEVAGETFAARQLEGLDLPVTRYLVQDETLTRLPFPFAITNYLRGMPVATLRNDPGIDGVYREMGALLHELHAVRLQAFGQFDRDGIRDPVPDNAAHMRREVEHRLAHFRLEGADPVLADRLEQIIEAHFELFAQSRGPVFVHDDFHIGNVLAAHDADGRLRLTGLIDFGNARAGDAVSDLAKTFFMADHDVPGASPLIREGYGPINQPDPDAALWLYTLFHRVSMWLWLRHIGIIPDGVEHPLVADLHRMAEEGAP